MEEPQDRNQAIIGRGKRRGTKSGRNLLADRALSRQVKRLLFEPNSRDEVARSRRERSGTNKRKRGSRVKVNVARHVRVYQRGAEICSKRSVGRAARKRPRRMREGKRTEVSPPSWHRRSDRPETNQAHRPYFKRAR